MPSRSSRHNHGGALLELALFTPVLLYLLIAVWDFTRYYIETLRVGSAATAAAREAAREASLGESAGVRLETFCGCPTESERRFVCETESCGGYGEPARYVEASVEKPFSFIARYPGMPSAVTIRRSAGVRTQ